MPLCLRLHLWLIGMSMCLYRKFSGLLISKKDYCQYILVTVSIWNYLVKFWCDKMRNLTCCTLNTFMDLRKKMPPPITEKVKVSQGIISIIAILSLNLHSTPHSKRHSTFRYLTHNSCCQNHKHKLTKKLRPKMNWRLK